MSKKLQAPQYYDQYYNKHQQVQIFDKQDNSLSQLTFYPNTHLFDKPKPSYIFCLLFVSSCIVIIFQFLRFNVTFLVLLTNCFYYFPSNLLTRVYKYLTNTKNVNFWQILRIKIIQTYISWTILNILPNIRDPFCHFFTFSLVFGIVWKWWCCDIDPASKSSKTYNIIIFPEFYIQCTPSV